jgi:hypothetical protein
MDWASLELPRKGSQQILRLYGAIFLRSTTYSRDRLE